MQNLIQDFLNKNASGGMHGSHSVYWIPIKIFNQLPITRWKHNRPPDKERVDEIHAYMRESKRVDGMVYIGCVDNQLVCYESNHRREAIKGIDDIADILVDIIWGATDEQIKEEFMRLNKAVSVPELYVSDETETTISTIRDAVDSFCNTYRKLKVNTNKPQRPNFNRDMVADEFYRVMNEKHITIDELVVQLTQLNRDMGARNRNKLPLKVIQKCEEAGLWLFAWSSKISL